MIGQDAVFGRVPRFGDRRLGRRFEKLVTAALDEPSQSIPELGGSEAGREGAYRFLKNRRVTLPVIMEPHYEATVKRMAEMPEVLVVHDGTEFKFTGDAERPGLGRMPSGQGFVGHFSLAVSADGHRMPLGLLAVGTVFRDGPPIPYTYARRRADDRESLWWQHQAKEVESKARHPNLIHVMDRESDSYDMFAAFRAEKCRYVTRLNHDRQVDTIGEKIRVSEVLERASMRLTRDVFLSARSPKRPAGPRKKHPPRQCRSATLAISAVQMTVRRPKKAPTAMPQTLDLNVVRVWEPNPPPGEQAVEWWLVTSESIESDESLERIVDWYRARWVIEEYFRALKQGCAYEKRQLETRDALVNALALFSPIAWRLLLMRNLARDNSSEPADKVVTPTQLEVLRCFSSRPPPTSNPTVQNVLLSVAALGGHIKNNGQPGWIVLGRGYEKLLTLEAGWSAALKQRKDQS